VRLQSEWRARREAEAGGFVLLPKVPTGGDVAQSARERLTGYHEPHGTEQHDGFLQAPVLVHSLCLKKPERIEALGLIWLVALLLWGLLERARRTSGDPTRTPGVGWAKQATERPTAFMMVTQCAGVSVLKLGHHRPLARPLSGVQHQYLTALDVPAACGTLPAGEERTALAAPRLSRRHQRLLPWWATDHQRTRGRVTSSHPDWVRAWPGDKGTISHRLQTLEARGLMGSSRSPGGKAESVWLTSEGQKWAAQFTGSGDEGKRQGSSNGL
jgi:hypothetical protein